MEHRFKRVWVKNNGQESMLFHRSIPRWDRFHSLPFGLRSRPALSGAPRHPAASTARQRHLCVGERWTLTAGSAHSPHPDAKFNDKGKPSRCKRSTVQRSSRLTHESRRWLPLLQRGRRRRCGEQRACVPSAVDEEKTGAESRRPLSLPEHSHTLRMMCFYSLPFSILSRLKSTELTARTPTD